MTNHNIRANQFLQLIAYCLLLILVVSNCAPKDPKFQQYFVEGEQIYLQRCSNCHQKDGKGLGLVYPPLAPSDFMDKNFEEVICLMKMGRQGEMTVNGNVYNQPMKGIPALTELEIAEIATYIYNSWGRHRGLVSLNDAGKILQTCY